MLKRLNRNVEVVVERHGSGVDCNGLIPPKLCSQSVTPGLCARSLFAQGVIRPIREQVNRMIVYGAPIARPELVCAFG
jgi:hypothetical protein